MALGLPELTSTLGLGYRELLTPTERTQAAVVVLLATATAASAVVAMGTALARWFDAQRDPRRAPLVTFALASALSVPFFVALTSGRRVRELAVRPLLILGAAALLAFVVTFAVARLRRGESRPMALLALFATLGFELADLHVLPRLYPAFHALSCVLAVVSAGFFGAFAPEIPFHPRIARFVPFAPLKALALAVLLGPVAWIVARAPNTSFVVERRASVGGHVVATAARFTARRHASARRTPRVAAPSAPGIDLHDRDVLLITVDALRADRLEAYGGSGLTPNLDRIANESVVFDHAYTSTPHTSYALSSLLTGKYLRPVLELPNAPREHTALPDRLRRYGYRTAAFYPPAIFFVDADRFRALEEQGFGFEYRKQMYAPAADRVEQVRSYLSETPRERPVFVWVHLFEPHEPYDPPARFRSGEGDEAMYDGEVRAADAAIGDLVREFRASRPGATVIVTADHGEEFGDHGGRYHGSTLYEEQVRVPLLWSSPGVVTPHRVSAPVEHVDLASTLLAALGVPRDVRMRGDDLGPLLAGTATTGPEFAFADIAERRMVTDGRWKAICDAGTSRCELFDLARDPRETRNLAGEAPAELARLEGAIAEFVASIPRVEAMSMGDESGWPEVLARAELGDVTVAPQLEPLLASDRAEVRAAAARAAARLHHAPLRGVLETLAANDPDPRVRDEAAVASVTLGGDAQLERVTVLSAGTDDVALRAALALALRGDAAGSERLGRCVADVALDEVRRRACVVALGRVRARSEIPTLLAALDDVRLRTDIADALATIGDRSAASAIARALDAERYVPPRLALARALFALGDRRFDAITRRYLGMPSGMPGGLRLLLDAHRIHGVGPSEGDMRGATIPGFRCDASGCASIAASAELPLRATADRRAILRVRSSGGAELTLRSSIERLVSFGMLPEGESEVSFAMAPGETFSFAPSGDVRLIAYVSVSPMSEIPVPVAEPWDAGVPGSNTPSP